MQNQSGWTDSQLDAVFDPPPFGGGVPYFPSDLTVTQSPSSFKAAYLHYHDDLEIGYCYSGSGVFLINDLVIPYQGPCASIIYKDLLHIAQSSPSQPSKWVFLNLDTVSFFEHDAGMLRCICPVPNFGKNYIITTRFPALLQHVHDFIEELREGKPHYMECARYLLLTALLEHARLNGFVQEDRSRQWPLRDISAAISYISNHYSEKITVGFLAQLCNMSAASLRRKFQTALNLSPLEYLHKVRITTAISMLALNSQSILEIGSQVGYNSPSSFNRQFLKITGKSPMKYRG